ncbi:carbohydrate ABC transporter permease [Candidatus Allofournierella excrementigallinarum]|uniref:carbohydrate ABC transporter permease n=1 Tax=Candidatus Allofournierella excrementigallinarum TaxID=2838592 RepID=UPI00374ED150
MKKFRIKSMSTRTQEALTGWLFSAPALIGVSIFMIVPFCMSVVFSFTNKMLVQKPGEPLHFTFFDNYIKLFTNDLAHQAFMNTLLYAVMVVPATILLGTLLAVFVNSKLRGVKIFRTIYFSPQVVTMTVVAVVWSFIFSSSESGLMNSALKLFGLEPQRWLQDTHWAMFCIAVMYIWQSLGLQMLIVLGGLQYIPEELYEAAYLDGCNSFQKFWRITVPMLKNTLVYVLISTTINTLKLFTQVYVLTNGGPQNSTTSVVYLLYKSGFINQQVGYSSAIAVVFFLIVFLISEIQNHIIGKE